MGVRERRVRFFVARRSVAMASGESGGVIVGGVGDLMYEIFFV